MPTFEIKVSEEAEEELAGASYSEAAAEASAKDLAAIEAAIAAAGDDIEAAAQAYAESLNAEAILEINYLFGFDGEHNPPYAYSDMTLPIFESLERRHFDEFPNSPNGQYPTLCQDLEGEYMAVSEGAHLGFGMELDYWTMTGQERPMETLVYQNNDINTYFLLMPAQISAYVQNTWESDTTGEAAGLAQYLESIYSMGRAVGVGGDDASRTRRRAFASAAGEAVELGFLQSPYHTTYHRNAPKAFTDALSLSYSPEPSGYEIHGLKTGAEFKIDNFISTKLTDITLAEFTTTTTVELRSGASTSTPAEPAMSDY